jgi:hypothetical protein
MRVEHRFVGLLPDTLEEGVLYISIDYAIAQHNCCCGCGHRVVTPLSPTDWSLTFDGRTVSLHPSIGNWSFPCKSHYWIRKNEVVWGRRFSSVEIQAVRAKNRAALRSQLAGDEREATPGEGKRSGGWRTRVWSRIRRPRSA